jgi:hypothetical protein
LNVISIAALSLVILYLTMQLVRFRRAFSWWQEQLLSDRYGESEGLRNQTLQSLFGIRRSIEQMQIQPGDGKHLILEEVQQCQQDLNQLCDRLFSAYGFESLPLALKDLWSEVVDRTLGFEIQGDLETIETLDPTCPSQAMSYQLLLVWIRKIFIAGVADLGLVHVRIDLTAPISRWWQAPAIDLNIHFCCQDAVACDRLAEQSELRLMAQMLTRLTSGHCYLKQNDNRLICCIHWMLTAQN